MTTRLALVAALICALVLPAAAAEQTFEGTLVCAKCFLKKPDAKDCQDILIVAAPNGDKTEYYIRTGLVILGAGLATIMVADVPAQLEMAEAVAEIFSGGRWDALAARGALRAHRPRGRVVRPEPARAARQERGALPRALRPDLFWTRRATDTRGYSRTLALAPSTGGPARI